MMDRLLDLSKWSGRDLAMMLGIVMVMAALSGIPLYPSRITREVVAYARGYRDGFIYATQGLSGRQDS